MLFIVIDIKSKRNIKKLRKFILAGKNHAHPAQDAFPFFPVFREKPLIVGVHLDPCILRKRIDELRQRVQRQRGKVEPPGLLKAFRDLRRNGRCFFPAAGIMVDHPMAVPVCIIQQPQVDSLLVHRHHPGIIYRTVSPDMLDAALIVAGAQPGHQPHIVVRAPVGGAGSRINPGSPGGFKPAGPIIFDQIISCCVPYANNLHTVLHGTPPNSCYLAAAISTAISAANATLL